MRFHNGRPERSTTSGEMTIGARPDTARTSAPAAAFARSVVRPRGMIDPVAAGGRNPSFERRDLVDQLLRIQNSRATRREQRQGVGVDRAPVPLGKDLAHAELGEASTTHEALYRSPVTVVSLYPFNVAAICRVALVGLNGAGISTRQSSTTASLARSACAMPRV